MFQTSEYLDDCPSTISISSLVQSSLIFYYVTNFCSIIPTNLTLVKLIRLIDTLLTVDFNRKIIISYTYLDLTHYMKIIV